MRNNRILSLDIIRGLAALSVLLSHIGNPFKDNSVSAIIIKSYHHLFVAFVWCNEGLHAAVIIFIVLSGFCIHMPLAANPHRLEQDYWPYYARRRFFRIYPLLFFAVVLGLFAYSCENGFRIKYIFTTVINLTCLSAIVPFSEPIGNGILLTVIVECMLYSVYPIALLVKNRLGWITVFACAFALYCINIVALVLSNGNPTWFQRNFFAFFLYWIMGAFAVEFSINAADKKAKTHGLTLLCSYLSYLVICHLVQFRGSHYLKSLVLAIVAAQLLCFMYQKESARPINKWFPKLLAHVGERSYSLYVVHWPVITLTTLVLSELGLIQGLCIFLSELLLAALIAGITYHTIELPSHLYAKSVRAKIIRPP